MIFPSSVGCIRWSTLIVSLCPSLLIYERKLTTIKCPDHQLGPRTGSLQFKILFSSGQAQMNGGGDFCIARYSYEMSAWSSRQQNRQLTFWSYIVSFVDTVGRKEDIEWGATYPLLRYFRRHLGIVLSRYPI